MNGNEGKLLESQKSKCDKRYLIKSHSFIFTTFDRIVMIDPFLNFYYRMSTSFQTDNTLVTVTPLRDYVYTASETKVIHKVDPETLDTISAVSNTMR